MKTKYRTLSRVLVGALISVFSFFSVTSYAQMGDQTALIAALQSGGYVVYMRHGDTTGEPLDRTRDLNNRALQRNLSEAGRAQAVAIGEGIRRVRASSRTYCY